MGVLGGKLLPLFWIPWLGPSSEVVCPGPEDAWYPRACWDAEGLSCPPPCASRALGLVGQSGQGQQVEVCTVGAPLMSGQVRAG